MQDIDPVFNTAEKPPIPVLEEYLVDELSSFVNTQKRASIALACIGEKPGEVAKFMDEDRAERFETFLNKADLSYISRDRGFYHKYYFSIKKVFLRLLQEKKDGSFTQKSVARFRGAPQTRIENPRPNGTDIESEIRIEDEKEHLTVLSGIEPANLEEKREALRHGRRREEVMKQFDRKNQTELGRNLLQELQETQ